MPAQITVGDNAHQILSAGDGDAAQPFIGHFSQNLGHRRFDRRYRKLVAGVHEIGDAQNPERPFGQMPPGMKGLVIGHRYAFALHHRYGQRVSQGEHHGGRGGWRQAIGTGFIDRGEHEGDVRVDRESAVGPAGHGDQGNAEPFYIVGNIRKLRRFPRIR